MKTRIFKYPINTITDLQEIEMPKGATILCVQVQRGTLSLWAVVDGSQERERRIIEIIGTGHDMRPANRCYIGTVQMCDGELVWHIYERTEARASKGATTG